MQVQPTPSTPSSTPFSRPKWFNKIRTPGSGGGGTPEGGLKSGLSFSTPSLLRRSSSKSSLHPTHGNASELSLNSVDSPDLKMPVLSRDYGGGDWRKNNPYQTALPASSASSLATTISDAGSILDSTTSTVHVAHYAGSSAGESSGERARKPTLLSKSAAGGVESSASKTLFSRSWNKSKEFLTRSTGTGGEDKENAVAPALADSFKSPPTMTPYSSASLPTSSGRSLAALSSDNTFPHPRSQRRPLPVTTVLPKARRVARPQLTQTEVDAAQAEANSEQGGTTPESSTPILPPINDSSASPPQRSFPFPACTSSPNHGRSRSDLVPSSPRLSVQERAAATVTLASESITEERQQESRRGLKPLSSAILRQRMLFPGSSSASSGTPTSVTESDRDALGSKAAATTLAPESPEIMLGPRRPASALESRSAISSTSSSKPFLDFAAPMGLRRKPSVLADQQQRDAPIGLKRKHSVSANKGISPDSTSKTGSGKPSLDHDREKYAQRERERELETARERESGRGLIREERALREKELELRRPAFAGREEDGRRYSDENAMMRPYATTRPPASTASPQDLERLNMLDPNHHAAQGRDHVNHVPLSRPTGTIGALSTRERIIPLSDSIAQPQLTTTQTTHGHPAVRHQHPTASLIASTATQENPSRSQPHLASGRRPLGETYRAVNAPPLGGAPGYPKGRVGAGGAEYQVPLKESSPDLQPMYQYPNGNGHHYHGHQQLQQQPFPQYAQPPPDQPVPPRPTTKKPVPICVNGKVYYRAGILGKGGSSRVYRVLDSSNNVFAIKKVDISRNDAETRASFVNEITLLMKLRGKPQIIQLVDAEINDPKRVLFMVMEVGEVDLNTLLIEHSGKQIDLHFIRYIWAQMLDAVQTIHDENVVHTDLKPANFVLVKGRLKLIDFGISKAIANDTTNIGRDQQIGTANYMPPEALMDSGLGQGGKRLMKLGRAADVWSLGCILHQMVYGRTPFAHIRDIGQKTMAIMNPRYVMSFATSTCPLDERGQERRELTLDVGPDLISTLKSCFVFEAKQRATIPELLQAPFLNTSNSSTTPSLPPNTVAVNDAVMPLLVERLLEMVNVRDLTTAQCHELSSKLMQELLDAQR